MSLSSLSQPEDIANLPGQSLTNGVHIAHYLESSVAFLEAVSEGGEGGDGVLSTNWLPCMGARFVDALHVTSIGFLVRLLSVVDFQFRFGTCSHF